MLLFWRLFKPLKMIFSNTEISKIKLFFFITGQKFVWLCCYKCLPKDEDFFFFKAKKLDLWFWWAGKNGLVQNESAENVSLWSISQLDNTERTMQSCQPWDTNAVWLSHFQLQLRYLSSVLSAAWLSRFRVGEEVRNGISGMENMRIAGEREGRIKGN